MKPTQMTAQEHKARTARSYKLLLAFAMLSMAMLFAGLTSAMVVSRSRPDWMKNFEMPQAFYYSTAAILLGSLTFFLATREIRKGNRAAVTSLLWMTLALGLLFAFFQIDGFRQMYQRQWFPVGGTGSITISFVWVVVGAHLAHLAGGLIALLIIIYNHFKQKYHAGQTLGIELGAMYWHFLDFIWVYLFFFLYFLK